MTHVWFDGERQIAVLQSDRPLPKRLKLDETWETRIECFSIPEQARETAYTMFRARLSTGEVFSSEKNVSVPQMGFSPGAQIDKSEPEHALAIKTHKPRMKFSTFGVERIKTEFQCIFHNEGRRPIALVESHLVIKFDIPLSNGMQELRLDLYSYKDLRNAHQEKTIGSHHLILDSNTIDNLSLKFYLNTELKTHEMNALRDELNGTNDFVFIIYAIDIEDRVYQSMPTRVSER